MSMTANRFSPEVRERAVKELRRANEILRKASAYFAQAERARELWRRGKW